MVPEQGYIGFHQYPSLSIPELCTPGYEKLIRSPELQGQSRQNRRWSASRWRAADGHYNSAFPHSYIHFLYQHILTCQLQTRDVFIQCFLWDVIHNSHLRESAPQQGKPLFVVALPETITFRLCPRSHCHHTILSIEPSPSLAWDLHLHSDAIVKLTQASPWPHRSHQKLLFYRYNCHECPFLNVHQYFSLVPVTMLTILEFPLK